MTIQDLKENVLSGKDITKEEALFLADSDAEEVCMAANDIRLQLCGNDFDMCGVISGKSGRCSENCRYCSQSSCSTYQVEAHPLLNTEEILEHARLRDSQGVRHYCIVSVGRQMQNKELERLCDTIRILRKETGLMLCTSLGLLSEHQFSLLKEAGVVRIHNNLETSRHYFPHICTSHTYDDKLATLHAAKRAGLELCCGGIIGLGETMEDRIDMALDLRGLAPASVPINILDPVPGTPLEHMPHLEDELVRKIIAIYRFILPQAYIRLAAGRDYLSDTGITCFRSGSNAAITGDMLTVKGITVERDLQAIQNLGYKL